ncbi:MAG: PCP reductase family protein [Candidatus Latescibacteria bacterium]|nr:PCP reductase family protein [Candidatus Latescibacterota bacterium]
MRFLCVGCDERMKMKETRGPDEDSMTIIFECPGCGWEVGMLTNPQETQMVRSLNVRIGRLDGSAQEPAPGGRLEEMSSEAGGDPEGPVSLPEGPKRPFADMVAGAHGDSGEQASPLQWTAEADERLRRVPPFVRQIARKGIEDFARSRGYEVITGEVMTTARREVGM